MKANQDKTKKLFRNLAIIIPAILIFIFLFTKALSHQSTSISNEDSVYETEYVTKLFDTSYVHTIEIQMEESDYDALRANPIEKEKFPATVSIDGEVFQEIAVSTKGDATLVAIEKTPDSDRYSLKLTFDKYDEDLTYYGLETIHLNNNVSDASYMRDYITYSMFQKIGCPAPLAAYTTVSVNGEPYGFFLAVEGIGEGFLNRTLDSDGELYKPSQSSDDRSESLGADLVYTNNLPISYNDIFENSVKNCTDKDKKAVIKALKNLSEGDIENSLYSDLVCQYFAVHNFTLNSDSYTNTSGIAHNYYLYENDGLLAMIPWDYNNAYALSDSIQMDFLLKTMTQTISPEDGNAGKAGLSQFITTAQCASYYINQGIDTPLLGDGDNRPMWSFIPENQTYLEQYHNYIDQLITEYFESGYFEEEFTRIYEMIRPYTQLDLTALYTSDEFEAEVERLKTICTLRAQSIRKQLDGKLSCDSTTQNQEDWIDASILDSADENATTDSPLQTAVIAAQTSAENYKDKIFDTSYVHSINLLIDDWDTFVENAPNEEYVSGSIIIDGEQFDNVAIRAKGSSSLKEATRAENGRYSLKIEFDHYEDDLTYYGLDKLHLNNLCYDATCVKDYLAYYLMTEMDVPSSYCSYVYITVNGEDLGLYIALEGIEESYLERNFGEDYGNYLKPDDKYNQVEGNTYTRGQLELASLTYIDDEIDSYAVLFNSAKSDFSKKEKKKLIQSIKKLNEQTDLDEAIDIDEVINYMTVQNFLVNYDGYIGSRIHNYYLYVSKDGIMSMLPWDYNLSFGGYGQWTTSSIVNCPLDTPYDTTIGNRPMFDWIEDNADYKEQYHERTLYLIQNYIENGKLASEINRIYNLIAEYVEKDPTGWYASEQFEAGIDTLQQIIALRGESLKQQVEGNIPSTSEGQEANPDSLLSVGDLDYTITGGLAMNQK